MKNKHQWAGNATPYTHDGMNDKSSSGRSEGNSSNSRGHAHPTRAWKATPMSHKAPTPASEAIDAIPATTKTHPNLSSKSFTASPSYGPNAKMIGTPKTGNMTMGTDASERLPKKWHKRGYSMETPSSEGSLMRRKNGL